MSVAVSVKRHELDEVVGIILCLLATLARTAVMPHPPLVVAIAVASVANVAALTWLVTPFLACRLEPWLVR